MLIVLLRTVVLFQFQGEDQIQNKIGNKHCKETRSLQTFCVFSGHFYIDRTKWICVLKQLLNHLNGGMIIRIYRNGMSVRDTNDAI